MSIELLQTLSLAAYIIAGVLLLVAVILFFVLKVPSLYGDVSGRTARKAIEAIRQQNAASGNKAYRPSPVNAQRGKVTDKIPQSGSVRRSTDNTSIGVGTEKLAVSSEHPQIKETTVLPGNGTTVLNQAPANETTVLTQQPLNETTVLAGETVPYAVPAEPRCVSIEVEMSFMESTEVIE